MSTTGNFQSRCVYTIYSLLSSFTLCNSLTIKDDLFFFATIGFCCGSGSLNFDFSNITVHSSGFTDSIFFSDKFNNNYFEPVFFVLRLNDVNKIFLTSCEFMVFHEILIIIKIIIKIIIFKTYNPRIISLIKKISTPKRFGSSSA